MGTWSDEERLKAEAREVAFKLGYARCKADVVAWLDTLIWRGPGSLTLGEMIRLIEQGAADGAAGRKG